jgi:hypothetical protein
LYPLTYFKWALLCLAVVAAVDQVLVVAVAEDLLTEL